MSFPAWSCKGESGATQSGHQHPGGQQHEDTSRNRSDAHPSTSTRTHSNCTGTSTSETNPEADTVPQC